ITHHPTPNTSSTPNTQHPSPITHHPSPITHYAIVMGNEVKGVKQSVVDMSDGCLEIPQFGTKHSLNVSVTTGIVIWEFARQLLMK
ncbi:TrmH family RNA methyltransferase, partial [Prevotella fusca]